MTSTIRLPRNSEYGKKPWTAAITGRDKKYGYARDFLASDIVTAPGLYACSDMERGKPVQRFYLVMIMDDGALVRTGWLSDDSIVTVVDNYLGRIQDIVPCPTKDGKTWAWRTDGKVQLRSAATAAETASPLADVSTDDLIAELRRRGIEVAA